MRKLFFVYLMAAFSSVLAQVPVGKEPLAADTLAAASPESTPVLKVKWGALDSLMSSSTDTTYIINFWATWCRPCVAELPHFEQVRQDYARHKVRVLLVSMDFAKDIEDRVIPFVDRMKLKSTVWLLNEPDANSWIEQVDTSWSGALPATLIINSARPRRMFFEKALDYETLARELSYFIEY